MSKRKGGGEDVQPQLVSSMCLQKEVTIRAFSWFLP